MLVYKIYAVHEDKMVQKFYRGFMPTYTKNGMLYYSLSVAQNNLDKCNEFKNSNDRYSNHSYELKTYEMTEV